MGDQLDLGVFEIDLNSDMGMDQYLLIPFLGEWTSICQLFWGSLGTRVLTHPHMIVFDPNAWSCFVKDNDEVDWLRFFSWHEANPGLLQPVGTDFASPLYLGVRSNPATQTDLLVQPNWIKLTNWGSLCSSLGKSGYIVRVRQSNVAATSTIEFDDSPSSKAPAMVWGFPAT